jgi:hypothetical protein
MTFRVAHPTFAQNLSTDGVRRLVASYDRSANGAIVDDFKLKQGFLYTQVRAISARVNQNYDGWPSTELKKSYRTFLGKPVFVNHQNFDPSKARGRVVASRYVESGNDKFIEVIQEIDANRFPKLAHEIRTGGLDSVSMGVEAGFTKCSVCDNKATDLHDMCSHVKHHKGEYLPHAKTGKRTLVFENCYKLGFFELSYVFDPADETAVVSKVLVANKRTAASVKWLIPQEEYDPSRPVHVHTMRHHVKRGIPEIWSIGQNGPNGPRVIAYSDEVPMRDVKFRVQPGGYKLYQNTMNAETGEGGDRVVHAWADGHWIPEMPAELQNQSSVDYHPAKQPNFYHKDDESKIDSADFVHFRPDKKVLAYSPDNWGRPTRMAALEPRQIGRKSMRRNAYGEVEAPEDIDTLRNTDDEDQHFHHYVESPKELRTPNIDSTIRNDQQQEDHGLDSGRRAEDVEDIDPADNNKKIVETDVAHEDTIDDFLDWCDSINVVPSQDALDDFSNAYHLNNEDYEAVSQFLESAEGNGAGTTSNANQPVPHMSRRKMATYRYAEESVPPWLEDSEGEEEYGYGEPDGDEGGFEPGAPPHDHDGDGDMDYEGEQEGADDELVQAFVSWCEENGASPDEQSLDSFAQEAQLEDADYQALSELVGGVGEEQGMSPEDCGDGSMDPSMQMQARRRRQAGDVADFKSRGKGGWPSPVGGDRSYKPGRDEGRHQELGEDDWGHDESVTRVNGEITNDFGEKLRWKDPNGWERGEPLESDYVGRHRASNGKNNTSSQKKRRATEGKSMARETLASRGKKAASRQRLHRLAGEDGHFDSGPYEENNQGEQEEIFISQTPGAEALAAPVPGDGTISNTEKNLVARINAGKNSLARDINAWNNIQRYKMAGDHEFGVVENPVNPFSGMAEGDTSVPGSFGPTTSGGAPKHQAGRYYYADDHLNVDSGMSPGMDHQDHLNVGSGMESGMDHQDHIHARRYYAADGGIPDADTVNPQLSGTDDQSLRGQDFDRVQPDKVETQSKDASLKAFAAFDKWLRSTTGRTASQHGNANFIRRQAARWAGTYGYPVEVLFPALGTFLRQARRIEGSTKMRRTADEKLEVAAPQDRIDVEAPVSNTTDAEAQASQFDLSDFGGNASDNVADPDLNTDSQIWAPGEGVKESNRKADGVAAIRLAEAYIKAGLKPESDKYNLVAQFQTMRHATVTDRTRLLEAVLRTAAFSRRVTAGSNRGTAPRTAIPRGLMNGGGMSRSASVNRVAANDPSTDSDLFL